MIENISVVIIAHNAAKTLPRTLESLRDFSEVIVYENNSTDETLAIAKGFNNVIAIEGEFLGFGKTKNKAASYAKNEWVFSLDSDEVIPKRLAQELEALLLQDPQEVFVIKRDNYLLGKEVKYSGWGKDFLVRLYNKEVYHFNDNDVHEFVELDAKAKRTILKNSFIHYAVSDINQFLEKIIRYSDLAAKNKKTCCFLVVVAKAHFAFIKTYFFQFGFLDGWRGFLIAVSNFTGKFFRYTKRFINCKE